MRVLLVENPLSIPTRVKDSLATLGHRVKRITDVCRTPEIFAASRNPLVIIDLGSSVAEASSLCARLRLLDGGEDSYLVVLVPNEHAAAGNALLRAGADDVWPREHIDPFLNARVAVIEQLAALRKLNHAATMARQQREKQYHILAELSERAHDPAAANTLLQEVSETVARAIGVENAAVFEVLPDGNELLLKAAVGWREGMVDEFRIPADGSRLLQFALVGSTPILAEDLGNTPDLLFQPLDGTGIKSGVALAIRGDYLPFGVFSVFSTCSHRFDADTIHFLQSVALILGGFVARKSAQQTVERSERHLQCLIEHAHDVVAILGLDEKLQFVSPAVMQALGYSAEKLIGRHITELVHGEDQDILEKALRCVIASPGAVEQVLIRAHHANGDWRAFHFLVKLIRGECYQWEIVVNLRDVTERTRSEEQLRLAKEAAEASTRTKSEFLANMSHELRTPMTAILGFTDILLLDGDVNKAPPERIENLQTIKRNGEFLLEIMNDILDLSKIEADKLAIERIRFSLPRVIADVASLMRVRSEAKELPLEIRFLGPMPELICSDPTRVRQILINLIGNAVKFTDDGFVHVEVSLIYDDPEDPVLQFDVIDTGIGMTPEQVSRLFQPFSQADASTTRRFGGTGLGLTISKRLTEMLGGTLTLTSIAGKGSTFTCRIKTGPLEGVRYIDGWSEAAIPESDLRTLARGPREQLLQHRVLLAEDGIDNQRLIAYHLRKAGADVVIAENGQFAVEKTVDADLAGKPFDVILMDMQMPVLDGYMATRTLRSRGVRVPIIALTANAMSGDREKCLTAGCDDYASKPIDRHHLIQQIRRCIERRRVDESLAAPWRQFPAAIEA